MDSTVIILLVLHAISLVSCVILVMEYEHVRRKYASFVLALEYEGKEKPLKRTIWMSVYILTVTFIATGTTVLFLWQPHLL